MLAGVAHGETRWSLVLDILYVVFLLVRCATEETDSSATEETDSSAIIIVRFFIRYE